MKVRNVVTMFNAIENPLSVSKINAEKKSDNINKEFSAFFVILDIFYSPCHQESSIAFLFMVIPYIDLIANFFCIKITRC